MTKPQKNTTIKVFNTTTGEIQAIVRVAKTHSERVTKALLAIVEVGKSVDVGKGAEAYFRCAQTTLNRAVKKLAESGEANLFYITGQNEKGDKVTRKILAPPSWSFQKAVTEKGNVVSLMEFRSGDTKMTGAEIRALGAKVKELSEEERGKPGELSSLESRLVEEHQKATALKRLDAPKSMLNHRIRQLKKAGYSNVAIGAVLDIHESTVRRRLRMPLEPIEILLDKLLFDLEDAREDILSKLFDHPETQKVFGGDLGEDPSQRFVFRVHTKARKVEIDPKRKRVKLSLDFVATLKED